MKSVLHFRIVSILLLLIAINKIAKGQTDTSFNRMIGLAMRPSAHPVLIGQTVPNITIDKILNYHANKAKMADFKGKLLILDFWHQYCGACLAQFPKFTSLQNKFGDQLLILPVTFQKESAVKAFLQKRERLGLEMRLPTVVEDTVLHRLFPHEADPYEVWINAKNEVIAITDADAVNAENIQSAITGKRIEALERAAFSETNENLNKGINDSFAKNYLSNKNGSVLRQSLLTGYREKTGIRTTGTLFNDSISRMTLLNYTIIDLYKYVYARLDDKKNIWLYGDARDKRIMIDKTDSIKMLDWYQISRYIDDRQIIDFYKRHLYCYELILAPGHESVAVYQNMIEDLNNIFHVQSAIKIKKINVLKLIRISRRKFFSATQKVPVDILKDRLEIEGNEIVSTDYLRITLLHQNLKMLALQLNCTYDLPFVINAINDSSLYNLAIDFSSTSLSDIRAGLRKKGLDLVSAKSKVPVLEIKSRKPDQQ